MKRFLRERLIKFCAAQGLSLLGSPRRNRLKLYEGKRGVRTVLFHGALDNREFDRWTQLMDWMCERWRLSGPEALAQLSEGRHAPGQSDRIVITFDDGVDADYRAAKWMADRGIRGLFFLVPSALDRTVGEYQEYHRRQGIEPFPLRPSASVRCLAKSQVQEMLAMGHQIGAHNFAHRDLGSLRRATDLEYEITRAVDGVAQLFGRPCDDFAWAFGHVRHLSLEAAAFLRGACKRVYSGVRGLNVPGLSPHFFLRDGLQAAHPRGFVKLCLDGGPDGFQTHEWAALEAMSGKLPSLKTTEEPTAISR